MEGASAPGAEPHTQPPPHHPPTMHPDDASDASSSSGRGSSTGPPPPQWRPHVVAAPYSVLVPAPMQPWSPVSALPMPAPGDSASNVYVAGLPPNWGESELASCFSPFGPIQLVKILPHTTQHTRGAGFVHFMSPPSAAHAIRALDGSVPEPHNLDPQTGVPRTLHVRYAHEKKTTRGADGAGQAGVGTTGGSTNGVSGDGAHWRPGGGGGSRQSSGSRSSTAGSVGSGFDEPNVYVAGLPKHMTRSGVEALFAPFGRMTHCKILHEAANPSASRGIAFVKFEQRAEAERAIASMDGSRVEGMEPGAQPIQVRWALERKERKNGMQEGQQATTQQQQHGARHPPHHGQRFDGFPPPPPHMMYPGYAPPPHMMMPYAPYPMAGPGAEMYPHGYGPPPGAFPAHAAPLPPPPPSGVVPSPAVQPMHPPMPMAMGAVPMPMQPVVGMPAPHAGQPPPPPHPHFFAPHGHGPHVDGPGQPGPPPAGYMMQAPYGLPYGVPPRMMQPMSPHHGGPHMPLHPAMMGPPFHPAAAAAAGYAAPSGPYPHPHPHAHGGAHFVPQQPPPHAQQQPPPHAQQQQQQQAQQQAPDEAADEAVAPDQQQPEEPQQQQQQQEQPASQAAAEGDDADAQAAPSTQPPQEEQAQ